MLQIGSALGVYKLTLFIDIILICTFILETINYEQ